MKTLHLQRWDGYENDYDASTRTLGTLTFEDADLRTVECPWMPNLEADDEIGGGVPHESCVPVGEYDLVLRESPRHGERWHLVNPDLHVFLEPGDRDHEWQRYACMIHTGNFASQLSGCIAPGVRPYLFDRQGWGVSGSAVAMRRIGEYLAGETLAQLIIIE